MQTPGFSWPLHYPPLLPLPASAELAICAEPTGGSSPEANPHDVDTVLVAGFISIFNLQSFKIVHFIGIIISVLTKCPLLIPGFQLGIDLINLIASLL